MDICCTAKAVILYALVFCEMTLSKNNVYPDLDLISAKNINECGRCRVLTDSFKHWLDKTSRGKFEGGDAAWEEAKLKSYSRSEIRLVEIQESLCSELKNHQDKCYDLAEEAEQALETWWFKEDSNSDIYTWLCIDSLKYCCPQNHYGDSCTPCPLDKANKVCSGHGKCDGEGTRKGNGTCICKRGYSGHKCEECSKDFYSSSEGSCKQCHRACEGCSGDGASACKECKFGWKSEAGMCIDINECEDVSSCDEDKYCVNQDGSFICQACDKSCKTCAGAGSDNCTSCEHGSILWSNVCVNEKLKIELLNSTLRILALYLGLLIITCFIFRYSKLLASLVIIIIALYIYYNEKLSTMNTFHVISNIYF